MLTLLIASLINRATRRRRIARRRYEIRYADWR